MEQYVKNNYGNNALINKGIQVVINESERKTINLNYYSKATNSNIIEHDKESFAHTIKFPKVKNFFLGLSIMIFGLSIGLSFIFGKNQLVVVLPFVVMIWVFFEYYIQKGLYIYDEYFIHGNYEYQFENIKTFWAANKTKTVIEFNDSKLLELNYAMFTNQAYKLKDFYKTFESKKSNKS